MQEFIWLLLSYQVPAVPSKYRVYVWRKLKEIGAIYFSQGVAMLPSNPHNLLGFQKLAVKISSMDGGGSAIAETRFLDHEQNIKTIAQFRRQSAKEYQKIMQELKVISVAVPKNPEEVKALNDMIVKLKLKLSAVNARDHFKISREPEVSSGFLELLKDMSSATEDMKKHISLMLGQ